MPSSLLVFFFYFFASWQATVSLKKKFFIDAESLQDVKRSGKTLTRAPLMAARETEVLLLK